MGDSDLAPGGLARHTGVRGASRTHQCCLRPFAEDTRQGARSPPGPVASQSGGAWAGAASPFCPRPPTTGQKEPGTAIRDFPEPCTVSDPPKVLAKQVLNAGPRLTERTHTAPRPRLFRSFTTKQTTATLVAKRSDAQRDGLRGAGNAVTFGGHGTPSS